MSASNPSAASELRDQPHQGGDREGDAGTGDQQDDQPLEALGVADQGMHGGSVTAQERTTPTPASVLSEADQEVIARLLGMCGFTEDVNDGSMCTCGLPALNHDQIATRVICGDYPELLASIEDIVRTHVAAAKAEALREAASCPIPDGFMNVKRWLRERADRVARDEATR